MLCASHLMLTTTYFSLSHTHTHTHTEQPNPWGCNDSCNPFNIMKAILKAKTITFPFGMDDASEDIIGKLLQFDVRKRLGCGSKGVGTVKKQAYFKSINFNELRAFKIEAPFIPEADISKNFDVPEEDEMAAAEPWVDDGTGWADEF